jgi:hypothetical protein
LARPLSSSRRARYKPSSARWSQIHRGWKNVQQHRKCTSQPERSQAHREAGLESFYADCTRRCTGMCARSCLPWTTACHSQTSRRMRARVPFLAAMCRLGFLTHYSQ